MVPAARLERLHKLVQTDIDSLPDRVITTEPDSATVSDSEGGVSLESLSLLSSRNNLILTDDANHNSTGVQSSSRRTLDDWFTGPPETAVSSTLESQFTQTAPVPSAAAPKPPVISLQRGDLVSARDSFTPIHALARYPYKYCSTSHRQEIASAFFDGGKFWERQWDLFYVWALNPVKPLILVRDSQVHALLEEINSRLKLSLSISDQQREEGLVSCFPDHPRCLPRYLGRSNTREEYSMMVQNTPSADSRSTGEGPHPDLQPLTIDEFKKLMEDLFETQKAQSKARKARKQQERLVKQKAMVDQFKRAQRYLGLRPSATEGLPPPSALRSIDPALPAPYTFDQSVVFVCIDIEAYERAQHKITEVGVATLDTRDLVGLAPGPDGKMWRDKIRARHFRINEHKHLRNGAFVSDNADGFLFGESTFVQLNDVAQHVAACFQAPFGAHSSNDVQSLSGLMHNADVQGQRKIVFLGHDAKNDIRYLQQLGYDPVKTENVIEALDTAVLYTVWRREQHGTSLGRILHHFDILGWRLHNAGNDAMYTVQAMLSICVREAAIRGSPKMNDMREEQKISRFAVALQEAQQKAEEDAEGWTDHEADGDGGAPIPLTASKSKTADALKPILLPPIRITRANLSAHVSPYPSSAFNPNSLSYPAYGVAGAPVYPTGNTYVRDGGEMSVQGGGIYRGIESDLSRGHGLARASAPGLGQDRETGRSMTGNDQGLPGDAAQAENWARYYW